MAEIEKLSLDPRVLLVQCHQCQLGLTAPTKHDKDVRLPAKKPTGFMTNSWCVAEMSDRRCDGSRDHAWLDGGRAPVAAVCPKELCEAVWIGIQRQKQYVTNNGKQVLYMVGQNKAGYYTKNGENVESDMLANRL